MIIFPFTRCSCTRVSVVPTPADEQALNRLTHLRPASNCARRLGVAPGTSNASRPDRCTQAPGTGFAGKSQNSRNIGVRRDVGDRSVVVGSSRTGPPLGVI